jgi:Transmembrane secretion effector
MVEPFLVESWLEHLRQHERVTNADRMLQETVHRFQVDGTPKITHLIAAEPGPPSRKQNRLEKSCLNCLQSLRGRVRGRAAANRGIDVARVPFSRR